MTCGGNSINDLPENRLTKFRAGLPVWYRPGRKWRYDFYPSRQVPVWHPVSYRPTSSPGSLHFWHWPHSMRSRVYETVERPSVCPIDRQQHRLLAGLLLSAVRAAYQLQVPSSNGTAARRSAANAGSVTFTFLQCSDVAVSWHLTEQESPVSNKGS